VLALFWLVAFKCEGLDHCGIEELGVELDEKLEVDDGNCAAEELSWLIDKARPTTC
jgi:hypothetical protein